VANQVADLPGQLHTYRPRSDDSYFLMVLPHTRYRRHGIGPVEGFVEIDCRLIRDWNMIDFTFLSKSINSKHRNRKRKSSVLTTQFCSLCSLPYLSAFRISTSVYSVLFYPLCALFFRLPPSHFSFTFPTSHLLYSVFWLL
jgi:hypothetical protein